MKIDTFNIDFHKFTKAMERDCDRLLKLGAQKWLLAVLARIPIRTGFLAGAFTPLEDLVGVVGRDTATGKTTGKILNSRNPLLTNEKKLQLLKKKKAKIEEELRVDLDAYNKLKGDVDDKRMRKRKKLTEDGFEASKEMAEFREKNAGKKLNFEEKIAQENEYRRELMRRAKRREREILEDLDKIKAYRRITKRIQRLERTKSYKKANQRMYKYLDKHTGGELRGPGGRRTQKNATDDLIPGYTQAEVMRALDNARKQLIKLGIKKTPYNPKVTKEFATFRIRTGDRKGKQFKIRKAADTHPISMYIRERENRKIQKEIEQEIKDNKKIMSLAERIKAKQREKGMAAKVIQETEERVKTGRYILKKRESSIGKDILAFNEYYKHAGGKVLKTPRSGVQFAYPKNPNEIFGKFSGAERTQFEQQMQVVSSAKSQIDAFLRFREAFNKTANAESTIKGIIEKGSTNIPVGGGSKNVHTTSPHIPTGPVPDIKGVMDSTYKEIMGKTRTDKMFFSFRFGVNIRYWDINDTKLNWFTRSRGQIAFLSYIRSAIRNKNQFPALNNLNDFFVRRTVRFDGTTKSSDIQRVFRGTNV